MGVGIGGPPAPTPTCVFNQLGVDYSCGDPSTAWEADRLRRRFLDPFLGPDPTRFLRS